MVETGWKATRKRPTKENRTTKQPVLRFVVKLMRARPNKPISSNAGSGISKADITFSAQTYINSPKKHQLIIKMRVTLFIPAFLVPE
ncbi:hypothetical protein QYZ39_07285 [Vibrio parahaemolyticus]|nr:hypothetical protein [Vibrio parahaemolyticus]